MILYVILKLWSHEKVFFKAGARFTKHHKPKVFVSSIQTVWN